MYTVLLVDDEAIELETMEHYVPWEQAGIQVVGTARNGKEALAKLTELKPDIIVTDVRMPIMDGLEFGRRAKQIDKSVKIIYLSGHNEFQYIKSALNIEAAGYLLKPIDMEELLLLLAKVKKKFEEEQLASEGGGWQLERLLLRIVREPSPERRMEWIRQWENGASGFLSHQAFGAAYMTVESPAFSAGGLDGEQAQPASSSILTADAAEAARALLRRRLDAAIVLETGPSTLFVLFQGKPQQWETAYWELLREELLAATSEGEAFATIGLSGPYKGFHLLKEAFEESQRLNEEKLYRQAGSVIRGGTGENVKQTDISVDATSASLIAAVQAGDAERAGQLLDDWFSGMRQERIERNYAVRAVIQLLSVLEQHFASLMVGPLRDQMLADHWKELSSLPTIAHYHAYALRFCKELLKAAAERDLDRHQSVAEQIMKLIAERYHLPLTVEDIAKEVYLSPNYVRTIFKEKTGETILDYLTRIRMNHAAELLKDRSLKVRDIAHRVSYENVSYFCSVFQKHKGSTPNEYRKLQL
ncbi:response regulator [Paenibacillus sp. MMO-58]|uniref:response regulator n=1 Tax=Paenibacillus sp. MMO-58 TaxID=3081290 RepID=UPI0030167CC9